MKAPSPKGRVRNASGNIKAVSPPIYEKRGNWIEIVDQYLFEKDGEESILGIKKQKRILNNIMSGTNGLGMITLMFSDCDAGGGFTPTEKIMLRTVVLEMMKYISLAGMLAEAILTDNTLKQRLIEKHAGHHDMVLSDLRVMFNFMTNSTRILRVINFPNARGHSCVKNRSFRLRSDPRYTEACRYYYDVDSPHIRLHPNVLDPATQLADRIYWLHRDISLWLFRHCEYGSVTYVLFEHITNYYRNRLASADVCKPRFNIHRSNLRRDSYTMSIRPDEI